MPGLQIINQNEDYKDNEEHEEALGLYALSYDQIVARIRGVCCGVTFVMRRCVKG